MASESTYPEVLVTGKVDRRAGRDGRALVRPRTRDSGRRMHGDLAVGRKPEVRTIGAPNDGRVVGIRARSRAGLGIRVAQRRPQQG